MIRHCEHVKANGYFCGSPAVRGRNYCYFHLGYVGHKLRAEKYAARGAVELAGELPPLEDAASIQLALMQVGEALLRGAIEGKRAGLLLYMLQTASINLRNMAREAHDDAEARTAVCDRYDSFEQDYDIADIDNAASLRVEENADEAHTAVQPVEEQAGAPTSADGEKAQPEDSDITRLIRIGEEKEFLPTKGRYRPRTENAEGDSASESGPRFITDREREDPRVRIPLALTRTQYLQAKSSIEQYESDHNIDAEHPEGRKPAPRRAAISQKVFIGLRKPPATVELPEQQLATSN